MPRAIPLSLKTFRGHRAVKQRQLNAQNAYGALADLKPHSRNIHGPPFSVEESPPEPIVSHSNLLAYWTLQDNFGQVEVFDVNGQNPLVNGTFQSYEPAKIGNGARSPTGAGNGLQEQTLNTAFNVTEFTLSFWFKQNSNNNFDIYRIISKFGDDGDGNNGWRLMVTAADGVEFSVFKNAAFGGPLTVGTIVDGTLYFFVLRYRASDTRMLVDFFDEVSILNQNNAVTSNYEPSVTAKLHLNGNSGLNATYDEVAFWGRALTDAEVLSLWNDGNGLAYPFS